MNLCLLSAGVMWHFILSNSSLAIPPLKIVSLLMPNSCQTCLSFRVCEKIPDGREGSCSSLHFLWGHSFAFQIISNKIRNVSMALSIHKHISCGGKVQAYSKHSCLKQLFLNVLLNVQSKCNLDQVEPFVLLEFIMKTYLTCLKDVYFTVLVNKILIQLSLIHI